MLATLLLVDLVACDLLICCDRLKHTVDNYFNLESRCLCHNILCYSFCPLVLVFAFSVCSQRTCCFFPHCSAPWTATLFFIWLGCSLLNAMARGITACIFNAGHLEILCPSQLYHSMHSVMSKQELHKCH